MADAGGIRAGRAAKPWEWLRFKYLESGRVGRCRIRRSSAARHDLKLFTDESCVYQHCASDAEKVAFVPADSDVRTSPDASLGRNKSNTMSNESKQARLKEIVSRLGKEATPAQIREEAYRVGFGKVNGLMLIHVRNALWPDRPKHSTGRTGDQREPGLIPCPTCQSIRTKTIGRHNLRDGTPVRKLKCHECGHQFRLEGEAAAAALRSRAFARASALAATEKKCTSCEQTRPVTCFGKLSCGVLYRSQCKECCNEKRSASQLLKTLREHGLTVEQHHTILRSQDGKCAICLGTDPVGRSRRFAIDHCHSTGAVRGLLCNKCNMGVGNFDDDAARLEAAAAYLRRAAAAARSEAA
jgi:hypothetical protein